MKDGSIRELSLTVEARVLPAFLHFLQDGFLLQARVGCNIREFLRDRCRLAPETIASRIRTVFLDGMPVDDLDRAVVKNDSTLALSGAMPGLVGAVMRSNSPLRSFRDSITHGGDEGSCHRQQGLVRLKLFNTVMSELGPRFLREGILLEPRRVRDFLAGWAGERSSGVKEVLLDGVPVDIAAVLDDGALTGAALVSLSAGAHA